MADLVVSQKQCSKCGETKALSEYFRTNRTKTNPDGGISSFCKACNDARNRAYREKRKMEPPRVPTVSELKCTKCLVVKPISEYSPHLLSKHGVRNVCKSCSSDYTNGRHKADPMRKREYYRRNKAAIIQSCIKYNKRISEKRNEKQRQRYATDVMYSLKRRMGNAMRYSLKTGKANKSWQSIVPYSLAELKKHLLKTMPVGYQWDDFLSGKLHIDHRIPIAAHHFESIDDIDFQKAWALENLQLLPGRQNILKGAKLLKPFQPSFSGL